MAPGVRRQALVACCVLLAFVMRASDLVSDPPIDLEDSGGYFADEGFWTHNARNKVLFGEWVLDEWNNMYSSPLTHWPQYLSFRTMGVGLAQARLLPALLSAASCALVATLPGAAGVVAAGLFAVDPLLLHFGRIALLETPVIFMLLLSWALVSGAPGRFRLAGAGLAAGLGMATKLTAGYFMPAAALALLISPPPYGRLRSLALFAAGVVAAGLVWVLLVGEGMPLFLQYTRYYASQQSPWPAQLRANLGSVLLFARFRYTPAVTVAGFIVAGGLIFPSVRGRLPREVTLACLWFVLGALYLNTLAYNPLRYYMPLLPALVIMVAWASVEAWRGSLRPMPFPLGIMLALVFLWPPFWAAVVDLRPSAVYWPRWRVAAAFSAAVIGLAGSWWCVLGMLRRRALSRAAAVAVVFLCAGVGIRAYAGWVSGRQQVVASISRDLGRRFTRAVFTGQWAPELCLENGHRAVPVWPGFVNGEGDPFASHGITHGVIWGRHWERFAHWFPEHFGTVAILDTLWIKDSPVILCEFVSRPRPGPREPDAEVAPPTEAALTPEP